MPRPHRIIAHDLSYHVIARCSNEDFLFQATADFQLYLNCLAQTMRQFPFELNNYTLMNNHVHLILTTLNEFGIDRIIHHAHLAFSKHYNRRHSRSAHFWKDRYKSPVIDNDIYGLTCMRYINRNPIRAKMVKRAEDWPWSAYRFYAFGEPNPLITPFPPYLAVC